MKLIDAGFSARTSLRSDKHRLANQCGSRLIIRVTPEAKQESLSHKFSHANKSITPYYQNNVVKNPSMHLISSCWDSHMHIANMFCFVSFFIYKQLNKKLRSHLHKQMQIMQVFVHKHLLKKCVIFVVHVVSYAVSPV